MADNVIRKACDRCHVQKLSCKRVADGACERCVRLQAECKSSPSLRYTKTQSQLRRHQQQDQEQQSQSQSLQQFQPLQQQHHQQQPQPQPQQELEQQTHQKLHQLHNTPSLQQQLLHPSGQLLAQGRTQKRRRTRGELHANQPETVKADSTSTPLQIGDHSTAASSTAGPEAPLDLDCFGYGFGQQDFPGPSQTESLAGVQVAVDVYQNPSPFAEHWEQHIAASLGTYQQAQSLPFAASVDTHFNRIEPIVVAKGPLCVPEAASPGSHLQRPRRRQIELRRGALDTDTESEDEEADWMAKLADINARLLALASMLPPPQSGPSNVRYVADGVAFPIDEMYDLSGAVAKILERLYKKDLKENTFQDGSDPGNSMFLLSVYVRLLDLYQRVFSLLRLELPQVKSGEHCQSWKLPDVTVGTFTVDSMPTLHLSLTVQLGEELLVRLRDSMARLLPGLGDEAEQTMGSSMFSDVVDISWRAMKAKGETLAKVLADFRGEIEAA